MLCYSHSMPRSSYRGKSSSVLPPANIEQGAALIQAAAVKLYDQANGQGVEWQTVTEALFRAAFDALDKLPDNACRSIARRVHEGSYGRVTDGPRAAGAAGAPGVGRGQETGPAHDRGHDATP